MRRGRRKLRQSSPASRKDQSSRDRVDELAPSGPGRDERFKDAPFSKRMQKLEQLALAIAITHGTELARSCGAEMATSPRHAARGCVIHPALAQTARTP